MDACLSGSLVTACTPRTVPPQAIRRDHQAAPMPAQGCRRAAAPHLAACGPVLRSKVGRVRKVELIGELLGLGGGSALQQALRQRRCGAQRTWWTDGGAAAAARPALRCVAAVLHAQALARRHASAGRELVRRVWVAVGCSLGCSNGGGGGCPRRPDLCQGLTSLRSLACNPPEALAAPPCLLACPPPGMGLRSGCGAVPSVLSFQGARQRAGRPPRHPGVHRTPVGPSRHSPLLLPPLHGRWLLSCARHGCTGDGCRPGA